MVPLCYFRDRSHVARRFEVRVGHGLEEAVEPTRAHGHDQVPRSRACIQERVRRPARDEYDVASCRLDDPALAYEFVRSGDDGEDLIGVVVNVKRRSSPGIIVVRGC